MKQWLPHMEGAGGKNTEKKKNNKGKEVEANKTTDQTNVMKRCVGGGGPTNPTVDFEIASLQLGLLYFTSHYAAVAFWKLLFVSLNKQQNDSTETSRGNREEKLNPDRSL